METAGADMDAPTASCNYRSVFIDSNLDTHLVMVLSDEDTVRHFKQKIAFEHHQCFPNIGEIKILALMVKRKGYFYHLSDSMLVKSALDAFKKEWFLYIDVSGETKQSERCFGAPNASDRTNTFLPDEPSKRLSMHNNTSLLQLGCEEQANKHILQDCNLNAGKPNSVLNNLEMENRLPEDGNVLLSPSKNNLELVNEITNIEDNYRKPVSPVISERMELQTQGKCSPLDDDVNVFGSHNKSKEDCFMDETEDVQCNTVVEEKRETDSVEKKTDKVMKMNEDTVLKNDLEVKNASLYALNEDQLQQETLVLENSHGNADLGMRIDEEPSSCHTLKRKCHGELETCNEFHLELKDTSLYASNEDQLQQETLVLENSHDNADLGMRIDEEPTSCDTLERKRHGELKTGNESHLVEDDPLLVTNVGKCKKKRKTTSKVTSEQVASPVPSLKGAVSKEVITKKVQMMQEFGTASTLGETIQAAKIGEPCGEILVEKQSSPVQVVVDGKNTPRSLVGTDVKGCAASNFESKPDVSETTNGSVVKRAKHLRRHQTVSAKDLPPHAAKQPSNPLNQDMTAKGLTVSPQASGGVGADSAGKRLKSRASKSVAIRPAESGINHTNGFASGVSSEDPNVASKRDHSSDEATDEVSNSSQIKKSVASKTKRSNTSLVSAALGVDKIRDNEGMEVLQVTHVRKEAKGENKDGNPRNKSRKHGSIATEDVVESPRKEHSVIIKDTVVSKDAPTVPMRIKDPMGGDERGKTDTSKAPKKTSRRKKISVAGSELDKPQKHAGAECDYSDDQRMLGDDESSQIPSSHSIEGDAYDLPCEGNTCDIRNVNSQIGGNRGPTDASVESNGVNFSDYFLPTKNGNEATPSKRLADKATAAKQSDMKPKFGKPSKENVHATGASHHSQALNKSNKDQESTERFEKGKSKVRKALSNSEAVPLRDKKSVKVPASPHQKDSSKGRNEASAAANSSFGDSRKLIGKNSSKGHQLHLEKNPLTAKKSLGSNMGEVVNNPGPKKSLLARTGAIFNDGGSDSSEDDDGVENSDASTRSPSGSSSSSGSSGATDMEKKQRSKNDIKDARGRSSGAKDLTLDMLMRSSSRYKNAKLRASSQLDEYDDTENQPLDVVPDSQA